MSLNNADDLYPMPYDGEAEELFCFDPTTRAFRMFLLVGCCVLTLGSYFVSDLPGAIGADEITRFFNVPEPYYALLYSFGVLPNVVLPLIGGFFVDRYLGPRYRIISPAHQCHQCERHSTVLLVSIRWMDWALMQQCSVDGAVCCLHRWCSVAS
jgi:MFS family permease